MAVRVFVGFGEWMLIRGWETVLDGFTLETRFVHLAVKTWENDRRTLIIILMDRGYLLALFMLEIWLRKEKMTYTLSWIGLVLHVWKMSRLHIQRIIGTSSDQNTDHLLFLHCYFYSYDRYMKYLDTKIVCSHYYIHAQCIFCMTMLLGQIKYEPKAAIQIHSI